MKNLNNNLYPNNTDDIIRWVESYFNLKINGFYPKAHQWTVNAFTYNLISEFGFASLP